MKTFALVSIGNLCFDIRQRACCTDALRVIGAIVLTVASIRDFEDGIGRLSDVVLFPSCWGALCLAPPTQAEPNSAKELVADRQDNRVQWVTISGSMVQQERDLDRCQSQQSINTQMLPVFFRQRVEASRRGMLPVHLYCELTILLHDCAGMNMIRRQFL